MQHSTEPLSYKHRLTGIDTNKIALVKLNVNWCIKMDKECPENGQKLICEVFLARIHENEAFNDKQFVSNTSKYMFENKQNSLSYVIQNSS